MATWRFWRRAGETSLSAAASLRAVVPSSGMERPRDALRPVDTMDGLIWVDPSGTIRVNNPRGIPGKYPVMVVPDSPYLQVSLNGTPITGEVVVEETDYIHVRTVVEPPEARAEVEVSEDGMEARLSVTYRPGARRALAPSTPANLLVLRPLVARIEPPRITMAQVRRELARTGVVAGLVPTRRIESWLANGDPGDWVVARGTAPRGGAGTLEILRPESLDGPWVVEAGTIIGRRIPDPARPGLTVRGEPLPAPPIRPAAAVQMGAGVGLMTHNTHLVAQRSGYVVADAHIIDVVRVEEIDEVGPAASALLVDGDLRVTGNVRGRRVVVSGNLIVGGSIEDADVVVGGGIEVAGDAARSVVSMGIGRYAQQQARKHIGRFVDGLYDLELTIEQLETEAGRALGPHMAAILPQIVSAKFGDTLESRSWLDDALLWPGLVWDREAIDAIRQLSRYLSADELARDETLEILLGVRGQLEIAAEGTVVCELPMGRNLVETRIGAFRQGRLDAQSAVVQLRSAHASYLEAEALLVEEEVVGGFARIGHRFKSRQLGSKERPETSVQILAKDGRIETELAFPGVAVAADSGRHVVEAMQVGLAWPPLKGGEEG